MVGVKSNQELKRFVKKNKLLQVLQNKLVAHHNVFVDSSTSDFKPEKIDSIEIIDFDLMHVSFWTKKDGKVVGVSHRSLHSNPVDEVVKSIIMDIYSLDNIVNDCAVMVGAPVKG